MPKPAREKANDAAFEAALDWKRYRTDETYRAALMFHVPTRTALEIIMDEEQARHGDLTTPVVKSHPSGI
jgi:hypothetical protein